MISGFKWVSRRFREFSGGFKGVFVGFKGLQENFRGLSDEFQRDFKAFMWISRGFLVLWWALGGF